jgi:UTP--glucose-1-phosphate uridylyltransferase
MIICRFVMMTNETPKMTIRKAIFPVAGLGTRFLPATKATPKEMLPIVDKPLIQYAVEEAVSAGITEIIFVTSSSKRAIEDHFDSNFELESKLEKSGKNEILEIVQNILPKGVSCCYVRQSEALGLGHAVNCAATVVGDETCAVILADDLIMAKGQGCLAQMVEVYNKTQSSVVAVESIPLANTGKYGVVDVPQTNDSTTSILGIVEKPAPEVAPSNLAVVGRYILTPRIFKLLSMTPKGSGNEIQLTDAIARLLKDEKVYSYQFKGKRFDCGSKLGYLEATIEYALTHPEVSSDFRKLLSQFQMTSIVEE